MYIYILILSSKSGPKLLHLGAAFVCFWGCGVFLGLGNSMDQVKRLEACGNYWPGFCLPGGKWVNQPWFFSWDFCGGKSSTNITGVNSPTYDSWDEPPSIYTDR